MANEVDPFFEERVDWLFASIVHMLFNANRGKDQKALPLKDFVMKFGDIEEVKKKQTPEQQFAMLKVLAAMHAGAAEQPKVILTDSPAEIGELEKARLAMGIQSPY